MNPDLSQTLARATHVTRGFRRVVMATADGRAGADRITADLADDFSHRGIDVDWFTPSGWDDEPEASPRAGGLLSRLSPAHRRAEEDERDPLDHESAVIATDQRALAAVTGLVPNPADHPVVVLLLPDSEPDPDPLPDVVDAVVVPSHDTSGLDDVGVPVWSIGVPARRGLEGSPERVRRVVVIGSGEDEDLALATFRRACQVVPGWDLDLVTSDGHDIPDARVHSVPPHALATALADDAVALVIAPDRDVASWALDAAAAGTPPVAVAATPAAREILSRCGYPAEDAWGLSDSLARAMADIPLRRVNQDACRTVCEDHSRAVVGDRWLTLMHEVVRNRR